MQIKTILNRFQKFKSFVYGADRWVEGASVPTLEVELGTALEQPSGVLWLRAAKARLPERRFELIPM